MPLIPQETLDEILNRTDIVEVVSSYIPLKRIGRNYKALCPFHHEKTASFIVSPDRQIYHCFGCGQGGNVFNFLMNYEHLEFQEAVEILAKKADIVIPKFESDKVRENTSISLALYKINELTADFYQNCLNAKEGNQAKNYLIKRGLTEQIIQELKLGFAPDKWDALLDFLRSKNISLSLMEKAGLIIPKDSGGYYDRFRKRIIFPILDIKNHIIAFGARLLDNEDLPKYINSPETPIYIKGRHLYGLNLAREEIRNKDFVVIVEGYLDFITPYMKDLKNITASQGTALTIEQIRLLKRYTDNVVMIYDSDKAGQLATLRNLDLFIDQDVHVKIVSLPKELDPDGFVRKFGIEKFIEKIQNAKNLFDYKLGYLKSLYPDDSIESKAKIVSDMLPTINRFKNAILKSNYIKKLAEDLSINEADLLFELKKVKSDKLYEFNNNKYVPFCLSIGPTEKLLVKLMLEDSSIIDKLQGVLHPSDFKNIYLSRIVSKMFELFLQGLEVTAHRLLNHISDEAINQIICELSTLPIDNFKDKEKVLDDCIRRLRKERIKSRCHQIHQEIKLLQSQGEQERLKDLMLEFQHLSKLH